MPTAGDLLIGLDGVMKYGTAGSTPSTEATNVDSVQLKISSDFATKLRRGKSFKDNKPTGNDAELTFELSRVVGDTLASTLMSAKLDKTRLAVYATEYDTGEGFDADWYVGDITDGQPNGDFQTWNVTLKYTGEERDGSWG